MNLSGFLQLLLFLAIAGGAIYGVYKLMQHNGDIKDLKSDVQGIKNKLPRL